MLNAGQSRKSGIRFYLVHAGVRTLRLPLETSKAVRVESRDLYDPSLTFHIAVAVLIDWVLASLPIVSMWNVQMSVKIKAGILVLMGMGYL